MLKNQDIICIANTTWHGEYTKSTVQILSRLADKNRILFVEYPFTVKDILSAITAKRKVPVKRMLGLKNKLEKITTGTGNIVYNLVPPPVLPVDFIRNNKIFCFFFNFNIKIYKRRLKKAIKKLHIKNPLIITAYNPFYGLPLIGQLNQALDLYYCYDGIGTRRHGKRIFAIDEKFSRSVNAIITSSDYITHDKLKFNPNCFVVKNGVDYLTFKTKAKQDRNQQEKKIVGYIGSLDHRFDIEIVEYTVQALPEIDFHFTGDLRNPRIKQHLGKFKNVKFCTPVQPHEVPALLATCDAGIIPYQVTEINKNIYPLKINEYLAVGVPVVMTPFADLKDFYGMVSIAGDPKSFADAIRNEIIRDSKELIQKRIEFAKSNSWDNKAFEFGNIIETLLQNGTCRKN